MVRHEILDRIFYGGEVCRHVWALKDAVLLMDVFRYNDLPGRPWLGLG